MDGCLRGCSGGGDPSRVMGANNKACCHLRRACLDDWGWCRTRPNPKNCEAVANGGIVLSCILGGGAELRAGQRWRGCG